MRSVLGRPAIPVALAALALAWTGGRTLASVVSRDLPKQLELIEAQKDGIVVYGTIASSKVVSLPDVLEYVPFTVLTVDVEQAVAPQTTSGSLTVYVAGAGEERLSISPPEAETRVGEKVLLFLRADAAIRAHDAAAYKVDSFAEVFRTQRNRKGDVVVLGEGPGSAVENNVALASLAPVVQDAVVQLKNPPVKQK